MTPSAGELGGQSGSETSEFQTAEVPSSLKGLSKRERRRLLQEERLKGRGERG
ncbi:MAG: hypothetical protein ACK6D3_23045 [Planctomycetaceae bacterium]